MSLERLEKLTNIMLSSVTIAAIVIGGFFGLIEYVEHKSAEKINRSLNQLSDFNNDTFVKSREFLNDTWSSNYEDLVELFKKDTSNEAYSNFIMKMVDHNNLSKDIQKILHFYEKTAICVNSNLCDEKTTRSFFQIEAKPFFNTFYPFVCHQREKWKNTKMWQTLQAFYNQNSIGKICN